MNTDQYITLGELAKQLNIEPTSVRGRARYAGVENVSELRQTASGLRNTALFSKKDADIIANWKMSRVKHDPYEVQIKIIEAFKTTADNRTSNVAKITGLPFSTVSRIINNLYQNNNCIIVESKMNKSGSIND